MKSKTTYLLYNTIFIIGFLIGGTIVNIVLIPKFESMEDRYNKIDSTLHEPLTETIIPYMDEFIDWLVNVDKTDEIQYSEFFRCGDFAATLMITGKSMGWRIRRASIYYSYSEEASYGDKTNPYGNHGHAFNFIQCISRADNKTILILYIEPQTDAIWWLIDGGMFGIWECFTIGTKGTVWHTRTFFVHHYSYTA